MAIFNCFLFLFFSLNTPPGTKVKLLGTVQVKNGFLLLDDSKICVLGGEVDHMVEKWELQRVRIHFEMMSPKHGNNLLVIVLIVYLTLKAVKGLCFFPYYSTCRVWPNTAGVTLEQKVDLLPLCHLVK